MTVPTVAPQHPHVLAFDTATEGLALALQAPGGALPGGHWHLHAPGGAQASATLLPLVHQMLARAGCTLADLDFIAFGCGPGAFTGLRNACAVAQGLGFGLGRPLLAIDSLLIVAEDARIQATEQAAWLAALDAPPWTIAVAMDARMQEAYAAVYQWQGGAWHTLHAPALYTLAALAAAWAGLPLQAVAGSAFAAFGSRLPVPQVALAYLHEQDRAAALLRLAVRAACAGAGIAAADALPLYLRDKVALTTQEREAVRAAAAVPVCVPL